MPNISYNIKTNITDIYFENSKDDDEFVDWLSDEVRGIFDVTVEMDYGDDEDSATISAYVNKIEDDHSLEVIVKVGIRGMSAEETISDSMIMDSIEGDLIPSLISECNKAIDIKFPMKDNSFDEMGFSDDGFSVKLYAVSGKYNTPKISTVEFEVLDDFECNF